MDEAENQINDLEHKEAKNNQSEQEEKQSKKIRILKQPLEQLKTFQVNFFDHFFNVFAHFMVGDLQAHLPTPCRVLSSF